MTRLTPKQREYLKRSACDSGLLVYGSRESNIAEHLLRRGLIRISCYGDKYFATDEGRHTLTSHQSGTPER